MFFFYNINYYNFISLFPLHSIIICMLSFLTIFYVFRFPHHFFKFQQIDDLLPPIFFDPLPVSPPTEAGPTHRKQSKDQFGFVSEILSANTSFYSIAFTQRFQSGIKVGMMRLFIFFFHGDHDRYYSRVYLSINKFIFLETVLILFVGFSSRF